jgi:hypothetical protein
MPGFPEHFIHFIILGGSDAGTRPSVQTNLVPASFGLKTRFLIGKYPMSKKDVETRNLCFKFRFLLDENNRDVLV